MIRFAKAIIVLTITLTISFILGCNNKQNDVDIVVNEEPHNVKALTLTGNSGDLNTTQHFIYFQDEKDHMDLFIDFIYLKNDLGNNTVFWEVREKSESKLSTVMKQSQAILTYKNILIEVSVFSESSKKKELILKNVEIALQKLVDTLKNKQ